MIYDVSKAKVGDEIYGMEFEGLVEKYTVFSYSGDKGDLWIRGGGIATTLKGDHLWFTTFEEAADACAIYTSQVYGKYRDSIEDIEDLIKFMYRNFIADNRPRIKPFREKVMRDVIREKALYFGIGLSDFSITQFRDLCSE